MRVEIDRYPTAHKTARTVLIEGPFRWCAFAAFIGGKFDRACLCNAKRAVWGTS
jgi:hypothetical protein